MGTFFSDTFGVTAETVEAYGAFDVSVINDLPGDRTKVLNSDAMF